MAARAVAAPALERPRLELSGRKLARAFEALVATTEEHGGVERYVEALRLKSALFRETFEAARPRHLGLAAFKTLCACIPTARRRIGPYLEPHAYERLQRAIAALVEGCEDTTTADSRIAGFCAAFPDDRAHRWVRDLATEILHNLDPERYPLMCRWVWDARTNTGVLREIWHADDVDQIAIEVPDRYGTFVMLREELAQYLAANGVFREVMYYVDLIAAQVYASYISEQGGNYLRADFATPDDPTVHVRRLLGLDGVDARGRTRLKCADGAAFVVDEAKRLI